MAHRGQVPTVDRVGFGGFQPPILRLMFTPGGYGPFGIGIVQPSLRLLGSLLTCSSRSWIRRGAAARARVRIVCPFGAGA